MRKYQVQQGVLLGTSILLSLVKGYSAQMSIPAIGTAFPKICSPEFMKGAGLLGSLGVNGMGGVGSAFRVGPTICVKQPPQQVTQEVTTSPLIRKLANTQALQALLRLQNTDCKAGKVHPKTQACFLFNKIAKQAKEAIHKVSTANNAVFVSEKGRPLLMVSVEKFNVIGSYKKKQPSLENVIGSLDSHATYNDFDDLLDKKQNITHKKKHDYCRACFEKLKENALMGGDIECDSCTNTLSINLEDFK
ncbi:hypothetical protein NEOKW01_0280 [Nematocida sp. AWRm80]|nr:hypothetical protein NEOKW01_0280 [Nematocida sp. AWRm80]